MSSTHRILVLLASALLAGGCASVKGGRDSLAASPLCCTSPAEIRYQRLASGEIAKVSIETESPARLFASGRSYFAAFELPQSAQHKFLEVVTGSDQPWVPSVVLFMPSVLVLDAQFKELTLERPPVTVQGYPAWDAGFLSGIIFTTAAALPPNALYVVVYTAEDNSGKTVGYDAVTEGQMVMSGNIPIYLPGGKQYQRQIDLGVTGKIAVRVRELTRH